MRPDVIVVGAGVVGCATALYLRRAGASVALIEARRPGWSASGRNAGAIRAHGRDATELPLALEARRLWRALAEESPVDMLLREDGDLVVALTPEEQDRLARTCAAYARLGLDVVLLDAGAARARVPALADDVRGAAWCASDLTAYPIAAARALAVLAEREGAVLRSGVEVTHLSLDPSVSLADGERLSAGHVILAAGARTAELAALAGIRLAAVPRRSQMLVTERAAPVVGPFVSGNGLYCRQSPYGNLLVGGGGPWELLGHGLGTTVPTLHRLGSRFLRLFPSLAHLRVVRTWAGTVSLTPDHRPLIGAIAPRLWVATGFNGHGFGTAPAVGRALAHRVAGRPDELDLSAFDPLRHAGLGDWPAAYAAQVADVQEPIG